MKKIIILYLSAFVMSSCVGTDVIVDQVTTISILPDEGELINGTDLSGLVGMEKSFNASATNDRGKSFVPDITWVSSDPEVASIDANGIVNLLSRGSTTITASGYSLTSNFINITVRAGADEPALISFGTVNPTLPVGESLQLQATILNGNGEVLEGPSVTWSSSDEAVFSVNESGLVSALAEGAATISATVDDVSASINFSTTESMVETRVGEFQGLNGYNADGNVELIDNNGELSLNLLDNFSTSNGPGLYLYLSNNPNNISGGIEVAALRKNSGADDYAVPAGITFSQYSHVIIYCKPFGVGFATAALEE